MLLQTGLIVRVKVFSFFGKKDQNTIVVKISSFLNGNSLQGRSVELTENKTA